ncbi:uncharacterized protein LTR77_005195 [Saxophila tyrrhenica]|uniref:RING-type domain-containing protein n=1 Tax=Saxophila tyrrhenica TaxID=1690608 RepID=A0AAV9PBQ5_9PEZI|nr:hypothetical protein LTR77_005195 [Saxophila tyrrhenica]
MADITKPAHPFWNAYWLLMIDRNALPVTCQVSKLRGYDRCTTLITANKTIRATAILDNVSQVATSIDLYTELFNIGKLSDRIYGACAAQMSRVRLGQGYEYMQYPPGYRMAMDIQSGIHVAEIEALNDSITRQSELLASMGADGVRIPTRPLNEIQPFAPGCPAHAWSARGSDNPAPTVVPGEYLYNPPTAPTSRATQVAGHLATLPRGGPTPEESRWTFEHIEAALADVNLAENDDADSETDDGEAEDSEYYFADAEDSVTNEPVPTTTSANTQPLADDVDDDDHTPKDDECAICRLPKLKPCRTPCGHEFCQECTVKWLEEEQSKTCPWDRKPFAMKDLMRMVPLVGLDVLFE